MVMCELESHVVDYNELFKQGEMVGICTENELA